jgi:lanthionine synthetase-like protein
VDSSGIAEEYPATSERPGHLRDTALAVLFDPPSHEPLTEERWSEARARRAILQIVDETQAAFDQERLWPAHPLDEIDAKEPPTTSLYLGASGVIWALDALARADLSEPGRDWTGVALGLVERYRAAPDFVELSGGPVPSFWMGEAGIVLLAHRLAPARWQEDRLLALVQANVENPFCELMWGSPGTMLAARAMFERTGRESFAEAWRESAKWLLDEWRDDLWLQQLYGRAVHVLGPAHGFVGNVYALTSGELLDTARRAEVESRAVTAAIKYALQDGPHAQWPAVLEPRPERSHEVSTQWCHGAPGIVASLAGIATEDGEFTRLLVAGGELVWTAGPLVKGPGLCHGTAGNGYAFLKLFQRTGDELWLSRARAFAMHAIEQVDRARSKLGRGRFTLWTGDLGTALFLASCIEASAAIPTLDG